MVAKAVPAIIELLRFIIRPLSQAALRPRLSSNRFCNPYAIPAGPRREAATV